MIDALTPNTITPATITVWAALLTGLAGSGHCFAMCGGMAGALGLRARHAHGTASMLTHTAMYQFGRISGYALAGALSGFFGSALTALLDLARVGVTLRIASGVLMLLIAARMLFRFNGLAWLERQGARFWSRIQPLAMRQLAGRHTLNAIAVGFLWGWLPCGLVYSMLLFAATGADALNGAAIMTAFGLGTLPSMFTSSVLAAQLQRALQHNAARIFSGLALAAFGVWMIVAANQHSGHENVPHDAHTGHSHHAH